MDCHIVKLPTVTYSRNYFGVVEKKKKIYAYTYICKRHIKGTLLIFTNCFRNEKLNSVNELMFLLKPTWLFRQTIIHVLKLIFMLIGTA